MNPRYRLRKNGEFQLVSRRGKSFGSKTLVLLVLPTKPDMLKAGFVVGKKVGGAVVRNRVKRRLRENFRLLLPKVKRGYRLVVVAREAAATQTYHELGSTLGYLLKKAQLFVAESQ